MGKDHVWNLGAEWWIILNYRAFHNVLSDYKHLKQEHQRTYLTGIVHSHRQTDFFLAIRDVRCVHHWWHSIQVLVTHASTWVHRYSSLLQQSVPLGQRGHMAMVGWIPGLRHIPKEKKKSQGIMSWDLGVHSISGWSFPDTHPIQRPGNTVFRYWRTSQWKWAGFPSCWNMNIGMFCNCGISHSYNMSRYVMLVTVSSAKNGPYTFWPELAQNTLTLGESHWCSTWACGFSDPHIVTLRWFTAPLMWNVASSLNCTEKQLTGKKMFELFLLSVQVS